MIGQTISHYQILEKLGEGGMGIVYKARDTSLDRFLAIKVLPRERVADLERKRRFVQEAKAASALNHPNIVTIYEIACEDGVDFIAMEYVRGKTLDQLIPRRGMPVAETLKYAAQIADALAKAHAAGIVHRDLKPGNIMVSEDGLVKVLDFGLAKLAVAPESSEDQSTQTITPQTEEGAIVGTLSYMSPEQAEGKKVDARSDIFAFGAVLYEMVAGQRAFQGESRMSTLAAILNQEPKPLHPVRPDVPPELEKLIGRCLRKDRERRLQNAADVKVALLDLKDESESGTVAGPIAQVRQRKRRAWKLAAMAGGVAGVAVLAAAGWLVIARSRSNETPLTVRPLTSYPGTAAFPTFSPDGNQVAFSWNGENQDNTDIYVRLVDSGARLRLTTNPNVDQFPAWSPDGRQIAFVRVLGPGARELLLISPLGGIERKLADLRQGINAAWWTLPAWTKDSRFLAVRDDNAIVLVSAESGEKRNLTSPPSGWAGDWNPAISPDGRMLAFCRIRNGPTSDIFLAPVSDVTKSRQLTHDNRNVDGLSWTPDGKEIVFSSNRAGEATLWRISASGGTPERLPAVGADASQPVVARQGRRAAFTRSTLRTSFWRQDLSPEGLRHSPLRLLTSSRRDTVPVISPDGRHIAFGSDRSGTEEVWLCDSEGGSAVQLTAMGFARNPYWSPDSANIVFEGRPADRNLIFEIAAGGGTPRQITSEEGYYPSWSRDGRWIYFMSRRTGTMETWKIPAAGGDVIRVTKGGGGAGIESVDGKYFYYNKAREIWKVPVEGGEESLVTREEPNFMNHYTLGKEGIYFTESRPAEHKTILKLFRFETSRSSEVVALDWPLPTMGRLSLTADGRWLLYNQTDRRESDILLIENFH